MIKKVSLLAAFIFCLSSAGFSADQASTAKEIVWVGIDYSQVRMIGADFNDPNKIFPGMLDAWNSLFIKERIKKLKSSVKKDVILDTTGVAEVNKKATAKQIKQNPGPDDTMEKTHLNNTVIAAMVKAYSLESKNGTALVYIADRFMKDGSKGNAAIYSVFFDIETRNVIKSERHMVKARGFGFRNFWFGAIKEIEPKL